MAYWQPQNGVFKDRAGNYHIRLYARDKWGIEWRAEVPLQGRVPAAVAARVLGVSPQTISNWIASGGFSTAARIVGNARTVAVRDIVALAVKNGWVQPE